MSDNRRPVKADAELNQDRRRLMQRRWDAGLGVRAAAAKAGITPAYLSFLEIGTRSASPKTLAALARAYGCKVANIARPGLATDDSEPDDKEEVPEAAKAA